MNATMPTLVGLCLLLFCVALMVAQTPAGSADEMHAAATMMNAESQRLEERGQRISERLEQRQILVRQLIDGKISLVEAAQWFRYYYTASEEPSRAYLETLPGASLDEKLCHQVIHWAGRSLDERTPSEARAIEARLLAELRELREKCGGQIVLPE